MKLNPNGRAPVIIGMSAIVFHTLQLIDYIDPNNNNVRVWESAAILIYLQKQYDPENKFTGTTPQDEADVLALLFLQMS